MKIVYIGCRQYRIQNNHLDIIEISGYSAFFSIVELYGSKAFGSIGHFKKDLTHPISILIDQYFQKSENNATFRHFGGIKLTAKLQYFNLEGPQYF